MSLQPVNIEVMKIEKGYKSNKVCMWIKFSNSEKEYKYVRNYYSDEESENFYSTIYGCKITFNPQFEVVSIVREYNVNNYNRKNHIKGNKREEEKPIPIPTSVDVEVPTPVVPKENENEEIRHEKYNTIKTCLVANIPIYLAGPAGSGKNFTVEQIANELGWNFYFSNSVQQEYKLTGFIDAGGDYHETEFYKACTSEEDCIFFLDEMDASIPEVLVLLNAVIANGYFEFPNGKVNLSHVHFVAAGNTVGSGADEMYTGRMVLDQATLDRFAIIDFDYSLNIEMAISENNSELVSFIRNLRKEAENKGIRATFSYRCITMVTKLEKAKMSEGEILRIAVFKGLDKDTINTFNMIGSTKYHHALKEIQTA